MFAQSTGAARSRWHVAVATAISFVALGAMGSVAEASTQVLKFYNLHTHEKGTFAYKRNGRYDASELKKINWFLRDWRKSKAVRMDPELLDLIHEAYRQSGSNGYINVICGYRSPATNSMLRSRTSGVAKQSQHTLGKALDFYIPDVPLKKLREIGLKMQVGGVGYYPTSGSPFVHFDVGNARHWPRMNRRQLLAVFPKGGTVHVPSDGKPLPGYQQALASYKQRRSSSNLQVANASGGSSGGGKTLLSFLFGGGADEAEDEADVATSPAPAPRRAVPTRQVEVASVVPQSRPSMPGGVAVAVGDRFDTSAPASNADTAEAETTEVAALALARVPLPTSAPSRILPSQDEAAVLAEVVVPRSTAVDALIADLEAETPETAAPAASDMLAYAIPMPSERPAFDDLLSTAGAEATETVAAAVVPMPDASPKAEAPMLVASLADGETPEATIEQRVAAIVPKARPETDVAPAALLTDAAARPIERTVAAAPAAVEGKGGRVRGALVADHSRQAVRVDPQEAIASRIRLATLVEQENGLLRDIEKSTPKTGRLVGNLPRTLYTSGFQPAEESAVDSDGFSGSAVNFLPIVKIGG